MHEDSRRRDAKFTFRSFFQTSRGHWQSKELGTVYNGRSTRDDDVTLTERNFQQADVIDVAIYLRAAGIAAPEMEA